MSVQKILDNFGVKLVKDTRASYNKGQSARASKFKGVNNENSVLGNSIKFVTKTTPETFTLELLMADHWVFINGGRKAGPVSKEGQKKIEGWIRKKGINAVSIIDGFKPPLKTDKVRKKTSYPTAVKQLTFLIARKKKTTPTDGTGFLDKVLNDGRLVKLEEDLRKQLQTDIKINITRGSNSTSNPGS